MRGDGNVVLFDTTWGTNKYKMKLGCFTTVGGDGDTVILGACLLLHEDIESFEWAFVPFHATFKIPPYVMFTDGDVCMARAIADVFPTTVHLLCIYHLSLNFVEHIKPLFVGREADESYRKALDGFWRVAKNSDKLSRDMFDQDFDQVVVYVETLNTHSEKKEQALAWLEDLRDKRTKWAARFTWKYATLGVHSTQVQATGLGTALPKTQQSAGHSF